MLQLTIFDDALKVLLNSTSLPLSWSDSETKATALKMTLMGSPHVLGVLLVLG